MNKKSKIKCYAMFRNWFPIIVAMIIAAFMSAFMPSLVIYVICLIILEISFDVWCLFEPAPNNCVDIISDETKTSEERKVAQDLLMQIGTMNVNARMIRLALYTILTASFFPSLITPIEKSKIELVHTICSLDIDYTLPASRFGDNDVYRR